MIKYLGICEALAYADEFQSKIIKRSSVAKSNMNVAEFRRIKKWTHSNSSQTRASKLKLPK